MSSSEEKNFVCDYFDEDIVYRFNSKGQIEVGVVIENWENSSSDDEEQDEEVTGKNKKKIKRLKPGTTKISWFPKGTYEVLPEKKVKLFDRSLLPGDVIKYVDSAKTSSIGYCKKTDINFCLKILGTNKVIENVNSLNFEPINPIQADTVCMYKSWVGYIDDTTFNVTLLTKDGSIVVIDDESISDFDDILDEKTHTLQFVNSQHYIGQRLTGLRKTLKKGNWINKTPEMAAALASKKQSKRRIQATVINVELASVHCRWMCCIYGGYEPIEDSSVSFHIPKSTFDRAALECGVVKSKPGTATEELHEDSDSSLKENQFAKIINKEGKLNIEKCKLPTDLSEVPCDIIHGEEVKKVKELNYFQKCTLQVGDMGYYTITESDKLVDYDTFTKRLGSKIIRQRFDSQVGLTESETTLKDETIEEQNTSSGIILEEEMLTENEEDTSQYEELPSSPDSIAYMFDEDEDEARRIFNSLVPIKSEQSNRKKKTPSVSVKKIKEKKLKPSHSRQRQELPIIKTPGQRVAVQIVCTETNVDVIWQNAEITFGVPSYLLYPLHHLDEHEFFPGDFVIETREGASFLDYGVVQKVDRAARTALVKWFKFQTNGPAPLFVSEEYVSVYDIKDHPDHHYRAGCCVLRVATVGGRSSSSDPATGAGQVIECCTDGMLLCVWADGSQSKVYPHELFIIGEYSSDDLWESDIDLEELSMDVSWADTSLDQSLKQTPQNNGNKRRRSNSTGSLETMVDKLRNTVLHLEEYFMQNPVPSYRNGVSMMHQLYKLTRLCKNLDENLGTSLVTLKNLRSLIEAVKPPASLTTGRIHSISEKLMKILPSSSSENCDKRSSSASNDSGKETDESDDDDLEDKHAKDLDSSAANIASPYRMSLAINIPSCQDYLNQLKRTLFSIFSNLQPLKNLVDKNFDDKPETQKKNDASDDISTKEVNKSLSQEGAKKFGNLLEDGSFVKGNTAEDVLQSSSSQTSHSNDKEGFQIIESVPNSHTYKLSVFQTSDSFFKQIRREIALLQTSLPPNIYVKTFEDRLDLYSVMIKGPQDTPYEDGLFLFDIQLPYEYPRVPPWVHYISYCSDRLNPNLYECGKVCVSLLGTWTGKGSEVWDSKHSTLLQLLLSIQGLILVAEPYYNEAGYTKQKGTSIGHENSRLYNEMVVVKLVQAMSKLVVNPYETFCDEIQEHFQSRIKIFVSRIETWLKVSEYWNTNHSGKSAEQLKEILDSEKFLNSPLPEFPLLPGSQGFCLSLRRALAHFKENLLSLNIQYE